MNSKIQIDLSKYRTERVAETVAEILSVQQAISAVFTTVIRTLCVLLLACAMLWFLGNPNLIEFSLITIYGLLAAIFIGMFLGLIRVAWSLVTNCEKLMELIVETSRLAVQDVMSVRQGEKQMPGAGEVVRQVYEGVFVPMIEKAVAGTAGILSLPLLWTYRITIGYGIRKLISRMQTQSLSPTEATQIESEVQAGLSALSENAPAIEVTLKGARGLASYAAGTIRTLILLPMQLLFFIVVFVATIPIILYWLWLR